VLDKDYNDLHNFLNPTSLKIQWNSVSATPGLCHTFSGTNQSIRHMFLCLA